MQFEVEMEKNQSMGMVRLILKRNRIAIGGFMATDAKDPRMTALTLSSHIKNSTFTSELEKEMLLAYVKDNIR